MQNQLLEMERDKPIEKGFFTEIGCGGQGIVRRVNHDTGAGPIAFKVFSPRAYPTMKDYRLDMSRIKRVVDRLASVRQSNLLNDCRLIDCEGIYVMIMEHVDGYDLSYLLNPGTMEETRHRVCDEKWTHLNELVFSLGPAQGRVRISIATSILCDCLSAIDAMHRAGIVHADIKLSNIMINRLGQAKLIDYGAAFLVGEGEDLPVVTPQYAAPEVLGGSSCSQLSDLNSLGYVFIELITGTRLFSGFRGGRELLQEKRRIMNHVFEILPDDIRKSQTLMDLICGLVAPTPNERFSSAREALLHSQSRVSFDDSTTKGMCDKQIQDWLSAVA